MEKTRSDAYRLFGELYGRLPGYGADDENAVQIIVRHLEWSELDGEERGFGKAELESQKESDRMIALYEKEVERLENKLSEMRGG